MYSTAAASPRGQQWAYTAATAAAAVEAPPQGCKRGITHLLIRSTAAAANMCMRTNGKSYGWWPSTIKGYCCLAEFLHKTHLYQRATMKRNTLGHNICSENNFQQRSCHRKASTAACWALTGAPNCHTLWPTCCLLAAGSSGLGY